MEMKFRLRETDSYTHAKIQYLKDVGELLANNDIMNVIIDGREYCLKSLEIETYDTDMFQVRPTYFIELQFEKI